MTATAQAPFYSAIGFGRPTLFRPISQLLANTNDLDTTDNTVWNAWWLGGGTDASVTPDVGALTITGYAPTVTAEKNPTVTPSTQALALTGYAPTVTAVQSPTVTPDTGALVLTGFAPTVIVPVSVTVTPGVGSLTLTGYEPTVSTGDLIGKPVKRRHRGKRDPYPPPFTEFAPPPPQTLTPTEPTVPAQKPKRPDKRNTAALIEVEQERLARAMLLEQSEKTAQLVKRVAELKQRYEDELDEEDELIMRLHEERRVKVMRQVQKLLMLLEDA